MTKDFIEDFIDACDKEEEPYLIVYRTSKDGFCVRSALICESKEVEEELLELIKELITDNE